MTRLEIGMLVALVVVTGFWWATVLIFAKRSIALVDIAKHGHLSGATLARMAGEALVSTGARNVASYCPELVRAAAAPSVSEGTTRP